MSELCETERTRLTRKRERGCRQLSEICAVLDESLLCHLGFTDPEGRAVVLPLTYARVGDWVYLHGARRGRLMQALGRGRPVCIAVTLLDGLVLARSQLHHSMNYRSVVVYGVPRVVDDEREKRRALSALIDRMAPQRSRYTRPPSESELAATAVVAVEIREASAKSRSGPPQDASADLSLPHWAGVVPLRTQRGTPQPDAGCNAPRPEGL